MQLQKAAPARPAFVDTFIKTCSKWSTMKHLFNYCNDLGCYAPCSEVMYKEHQGIENTLSRLQNECPRSSASLKLKTWSRHLCMITTSGCGRHLTQASGRSGRSTPPYQITFQWQFPNPGSGPPCISPLPGLGGQSPSVFFFFAPPGGPAPLLARMYFACAFSVFVCLVVGQCLSPPPSGFAPIDFNLKQFCGVLGCSCLGCGQLLCNSTAAHCHTAAAQGRRTSTAQRRTKVFA